MKFLYGRIFMKFDVDGFSWNFIWTDFHEIWYGL